MPGMDGLSHHVSNETPRPPDSNSRRVYKDGSFCGRVPLKALSVDVNSHQGNLYQDDKKQWCQDMFDEESGTPLTAYFSVQPHLEGSLDELNGLILHLTVRPTPEPVDESVVLVEFKAEMELAGREWAPGERMWTTAFEAMFLEESEFATIVFPE